MCSAITALIQCTSPCVGFWLCTPPTGIVLFADAVGTDVIGIDVGAEMLSLPLVTLAALPVPGLLLLLLTALLLLFVSLLLPLIVLSPLSAPFHGNAPIADFCKYDLSSEDRLFRRLIYGFGSN